MASHSDQPSVQPRQLRPPEPVSIATPLPPSHPTQLFTPAFAAAQLVTGPDPLQHVTIPATQMATIPATSAGVQLVVWAVSHGPSANLAGSQRREIPFIEQEDILGIDPRIRLETELLPGTCACSGAQTLARTCRAAVLTRSMGELACVSVSVHCHSCRSDATTAAALSLTSTSLPLSSASLSGLGPGNIVHA